MVYGTEIVELSLGIIFDEWGAGRQEAQVRSNCSKTNHHMIRSLTSWAVFHNRYKPQRLEHSHAQTER